MNIKELDVKKENGAVDIAKLIMAVLVIIIHKPVFSESHPFLNYITGNTICAIAVPFFFITSSYFFFSRVDREGRDNKLFFNFEKRLFKLYFLWTVIYLPCIFVKYNTNHYDTFNAKIFIGQLLLTAKKFFLSTSFIHLWYVNTLMLSVAIIYFLYKKLGTKATFVICAVIATAFNIIAVSATKDGIVLHIYNAFPDILHKTFEKGILFTSGGFLFSKIKKQEKNSVWEYLIMILSIMALIINGAFRYRTENKLFDYFHIIIIFIASLMIFAVCINIKTKPSKAYYIIRKYSTVMYFSHLLLMTEGFSYIAYKTGITAFADNELFIFFITVLFAVIISTIIIFLSEKQKFKKLKYLY